MCSQLMKIKQMDKTCITEKSCLLSKFNNLLSDDKNYIQYENVSPTFFHCSNSIDRFS